MALAGSRHEVAAVLTREDSEQGRHRVMTPTPVAAAASELGLPVVKTNRLDTAATEAIASFEPELGVVVAYGSLVRQPLLSLPRLGWINLHFSLLPRWRGAAPCSGRSSPATTSPEPASSNSCRNWMPGSCTASSPRRSSGDETAGQLLESLADGGAELLDRVVDALAEGTARAEPQAGDVTLAPKLTLADGQIDWTAPTLRRSATSSAGSPRNPARSPPSAALGSRFSKRSARTADSRLPPGSSGMGWQAGAGRDRRPSRSNCCGCIPPAGRQWPQRTGGVGAHGPGRRPSSESGPPGAPDRATT